MTRSVLSLSLILGITILSLFLVFKAASFAVSLLALFPVSPEEEEWTQACDIHYSALTIHNCRAIYSDAHRGWREGAYAGAVNNCFIRSKHDEPMLGECLDALSVAKADILESHAE